ncbi:hypothetical protein BGZ51_007465 [Haplosporangium sp. Z 767]|nr:hypothetical protein BGZ50_007530 [Haplosporangium sp. Z 11]KAF9178801.1 hypothetical protein BGZ51_007465 [Haplosporangium sp. Z 767]
MIDDHLVTRTGVRSLTWIISGIVPLGSSYFCYMLAYKESPVNTLINQIPFMLQLLQANASSVLSSLDNSGSNSFHQYSLVNSIPVINNLSPGSPSSTSIMAAAATATSFPSEVPTVTILSPALSMFVSFVRYLESRGYDNMDAIPGFRYLVALEPLKRHLDPVLRFLSSHQTLAWTLTVLHLWLAAELVFFILFWKKLARLQLVDRVVKGVGSKAKRKELFQRCLETVEEGDGFKRWIEVWFDTGRTKQLARFEDIGRENMIHWLAWAFWAAPAEEVFELPFAIAELDQMVDTIEEDKKVKFAKGFNPNVECIRLCLDPVVASHRPLVYYGFVWLASFLVGLLLRILGFTRYDNTTHQIQYNNKPSPDTKSAPSTRTPPDIAYWYKPCVDPAIKTPLVFVHGIGLGLVPYIHLIVAMTSISRPLILIELPYVASRLIQTDCMTPDETYFAIERILKTHKHSKATFMGHSFGTMICAAVCRASPATSPNSIVDGLILADPICFLTHHSLARNFAYRAPATATQLVIDLFAAREIGTSWYIMRRFCWSQCMFPIAWARRHQKPLLLQGSLSPVLPQKTRVFLSRNDTLLDMTKVATYLKTQVGLEGKDDEDQLVMMEGMDHAQFLLRTKWFSKILKAAREC